MKTAFSEVRFCECQPHYAVVYHYPLLFFFSSLSLLLLTLSLCLCTHKAMIVVWLKALLFDQQKIGITGSWVRDLCSIACILTFFSMSFLKLKKKEDVFFINQFFRECILQLFVRFARKSEVFLKSVKNRLFFSSYSRVIPSHSCLVSVQFWFFASKCFENQSFLCVRQRRLIFLLINRVDVASEIWTTEYNILYVALFVLLNLLIVKV